MKPVGNARCWAEIELEALRHNARVAHECVGPGTALLAVIKANAYGHGLAEVAKALRDEAQLFGVANLEEAREARRAVAHPIIILGPALAEERAAIVAEKFIPSVSSLAGAEAFAQAARSAPVALSCVIDTGMGRIGIAEEKAANEIARIAALPGVKIHSVASHLPVADEDAVYTAEQLRRFHDLIERLRAQTPGDYPVHILPSAGLLRYAAHAHDLVRAGIMLYGASPIPEFQTRLRPALTWKTRVALVRDLPAGHSVSYGRTFITPRAMRVATISAGYADGLPRAISNRGAAVLIDGKRCAVLGRVTMDLTMVDVTAMPETREGDEVVLLGRQGAAEISATEMAQWAGTISWEIFTGIGSRVARVYG